jgi:perosamine synthetase
MAAPSSPKCDPAAARPAQLEPAVPRQATLPYARPTIEEDDRQAAQRALSSLWLTTGPEVPAFEAELADVVGAAHGVAVSSGTAGLHAALHALRIGPGDEVIVPAMTFVATANAVVYQGATPVFADVEPDTLLIDPTAALRCKTARTRAVVAVDYAGHPCNYDRLRRLCDRHRLALVADACHALGARYAQRPVGSLADVTVFSFHPVKHITTGEGGMAVTDHGELAQRMRRFRNHGIDRDHHAREAADSWAYEQVELGFNYRLSDVQCALGRSQLRKLSAWLERRRQIAALYDQTLAEVEDVEPLAVRRNVQHAYHLYVVRLTARDAARRRARIFAALRAAGIGANVHYLPVHLHSYYRRRFGTTPGMCPAAEAAYEELLSLPMFPGLRADDVRRVVEVVRQVTGVRRQPGTPA